MTEQPITTGFDRRTWERLVIDREGTLTANERYILLAFSALAEWTLSGGAVLDVYRKDACDHMRRSTHIWDFHVRRLAKMGWLQRVRRGNGDRQRVTRPSRYLLAIPHGVMR